jgi:diaminopimelate epimerase
VTVDLGVPGLRAAEVPTTIAPGADGMVVDQPFQVDGGEFRLTAVSTGVPHAVVFLDRLAGRPWQDWGRAIEGHPAFPRRTNVEFAQVISPARAEVVVWERGSGATLACGTGAGAVVVAGVLTGRLSRQATISLPGGDLEVGWRQADSRLLLTGPAVEVCRGEYLDPA